MAVEFRLDGLFAPDEEDGNSILPRGLDRTFDLRLGRSIGTHRVQRYDAWHEKGLARLLDVENLAPFIVPALGAGAMRHLLLVAVGAFGK
jgi:hypothetical protein